MHFLLDKHNDKNNVTKNHVRKNKKYSKKIKKMLDKSFHLGYNKILNYNGLINGKCGNKPVFSKI